MSFLKKKNKRPVPSPINYLLEEIEQEKATLREAVVQSQISPSARREVERSEAEYKKVGNEKMAKLQQVLSKNYHTLSPVEKDRIAKGMGFDAANKKVTKRKKYTIVEGSKVTPDVLWQRAEKEDLSNGQTFIYDAENKRMYTANVKDIHYDIEVDNYELDERNPQHIYGRYLEDPSDRKPIPKGINLAIWHPVPDLGLIDKIISKLNISPQYIHLPKKINKWRFV